MDRYSRVVALATLLATGIYVGLVVIPDIPRFSKEDLTSDYTQMVPLIYLATMLLLSVRTLLKPPKNRLAQQVMRGVLEGGLLAYLFISVVYFRSDPAGRGDGTFRWGTFYVGLLLTGPLFSALGAALRLIYDLARSVVVRIFSKISD